MTDGRLDVPIDFSKDFLHAAVRFEKPASIQQRWPSYAGKQKTSFGMHLVGDRIPAPMVLPRYQGPPTGR